MEDKDLNITTHITQYRSQTQELYQKSERLRGSL